MNLSSERFLKELISGRFLIFLFVPRSSFISLILKLVNALIMIGESIPLLRVLILGMSAWISILSANLLMFPLMERRVMLVNNDVDLADEVSDDSDDDFWRMMCKLDYLDKEELFE